MDENRTICPVCGAEKAAGSRECRCGYDFETDLYPKVSESPHSKMLVACKTCGREVSMTAPVCPGCGETVPGIHIKCPSCGSPSFVIDQQGYSIGKAAIGWLLLGALGLLGGLIGRKNVELVCVACGKRWVPDRFSETLSGNQAAAGASDRKECGCGREHARKKGSPDDGRAPLPDPEGCCVLLLAMTSAVSACAAVKYFTA